MIYYLLQRLFPTRTAPQNPQRIVLILPCCIGDVVLATATLQALRRGYPNAHITWAVGRWSRAAIEGHPLLDALLDTGDSALPVRSPAEMTRFIQQLRAGKFDLAVSLVRSPLMSMAVWLAGIPYRAGLDSAGRGFGYNIRAAIDPQQPRHEGDIYLDVARALGLDVHDCHANIPVLDSDRETVKARLAERGLEPGRYIVINPAGGRNPGMAMDSKRWPVANFTALANRLASQFYYDGVVVLGGPGDAELVQAAAAGLELSAIAFMGELTFGQIAALARMSAVYIGNDTGLTHLAAATGAHTIMILGPSDPARYAPFVPGALALWKPAILRPGGVAAGTPQTWDWARDGISVDETEKQILEWLRA